MTEIRGTAVREQLRETVVQRVLGAALACMTHNLSFRVEPLVQIIARMVALSL